MKVRTLERGEVLPAALQTGYEKTEQPDWIWVVERDGKPVAVLVTSPAHIMVILIRILATPEAQGADVRSLLLHAFREMRARGYKGYTTWLDPTKAPENAFIRIIRAIGGFQLLNPQVVCCGAF